MVYVNATASASGADGSIEKPYNNLQVAMDAKIPVGATADVIFDIAAGTYTCVRYITQNQPQNVTFRGRGIGKSIIQGAAPCAAGKAVDVHRLYNYGDLEYEGLTIQNCKYGLVPNNCQKFTARDCEFLRCGSSGDVANHDGSLSKTDQNARWTNSGLDKLSNGGSCRVDGCSRVFITGCFVTHCLRGIRVGGVDQGIISGNIVQDISESGIYLNSASKNVLVEGNMVINANNNAYLAVSCQGCSFKNNVGKNCWNSGVMCWHSSDMTVENNQLDNNGYKTWNGLGIDGDNWGSGIVFDGDTNIPADSAFQSRIFGNMIPRLHDGRANKKIGIRLRNTKYTNGDFNFVNNNYSSGADNHFQVDAGGSMASVEHCVSRETCGQIEVFSPSANAQGFQMQDDTEFAVVVHNNLSGCYVQLPIAPYPGQKVIVKNLQTNGTPSVSSFIYVQPSGSQTPTIDKRFYQLKLLCSTSTGDLESGANQCAAFVYVEAESTWVSINI